MRLNQKIMAIIVVFIMFISANVIINNLYLNPRHNHEKIVNSFISLNMLLSPSTPESAITLYGNWLPDRWSLFGFHRPWQFRLLQGSFLCNDTSKSIKGIINFRFGNAILSDYIDAIGLTALTVTQSTFMSYYNSNLVHFNFNDNDIYEVWICFGAPISRYMLLNQYDNFFMLDPDFSVGVAWVAIKTSSNPDDIAIGVGGPMNISLLSLHERFQHSLSEYHLQESELAFTNILNSLINAPEVKDILINSELWAGAETINFSERLAFINENGFNYLGFVALAQGKWLNDLCMDNVNTIRVRQVVSRSATP
ncbi:MAG: hypothetical protein FWE42_00065 [Defluviitaleaceae bacterium]|nr:hypothetical protein [Defluviitaleaceae bacterium]